MAFGNGFSVFITRQFFLNLQLEGAKNSPVHVCHQRLCKRRLRYWELHMGEIKLKVQIFSFCQSEKHKFYEFGKKKTSMLTSVTEWITKNAFFSPSTVNSVSTVQRLYYSCCSENPHSLQTEAVGELSWWMEVVKAELEVTAELWGSGGSSRTSALVKESGRKDVWRVALGWNQCPITLIWDALSAGRSLVHWGTQRLVPATAEIKNNKD